MALNFCKAKSDTLPVLQTRMRSAALHVAVSAAAQNVQFDCLMTFVTLTSFHFLPHIRCVSQLGCSVCVLKDLLFFPSVKVCQSTLLSCYLRTKLKASLQWLYFPKACQQKLIVQLFNSTDYWTKPQSITNILLGQSKT